ASMANETNTDDASVVNGGRAVNSSCPSSITCPVTRSSAAIQTGTGTGWPSGWMYSKSSTQMWRYGSGSIGLPVEVRLQDRVVFCGEDAGTERLDDERADGPCQVPLRFGNGDGRLALASDHVLVLRLGVEHANPFVAGEVGGVERG